MRQPKWNRKTRKQFITFRKISNQFEQKQFFSFFLGWQKSIIILEKDEGWRETWQLRMEEWGIWCGLSCLEKYKKDCYIFIMKKDHYERRRKMACVISFYTTLLFDIFFWYDSLCGPLYKWLLMDIRRV